MRFASVLSLALALALLGGPAAAQEPPPPRSLDAVCPQPTPPAGFTDTAGNLHERAIDCLAYYEVTTGVTATIYDPDGTVRRDQMASFIARFLEEIFVLDLPEDPPHRFGDVAADSLHALRINQLAEIGLVQGSVDGAYRPAALVRRDQMAVFLNRAHAQVVGALQHSPDTHFTDVADNPHREHIDGLAANGVVTGYDDGTYRPFEPVRRDQLASFLVRQADAIAAREVTSSHEVRMLGELVARDGELGHGEPGAWGEGLFQLNSRTGRLCYQYVAVAARPVVAAEIRAETMEGHGPVHLSLELPDERTRRASTCMAVDAADLVAIEEDPTAFSLSIATEAFPDGALRGQLGTQVLTTYLSWAFAVDDSGAEPVFGQGEPDEDARAYVQVDGQRGRVCVYLETDAVDDAAVALHRSRMHANGPAVMDLAPLEAGTSSTCGEAPRGLAADPARFSVQVEERMRGQLGTFALAVPLRAAQAPDGGEPGASGAFYVQYELRRHACYLLVIDAAPPHTGVELRSGTALVTTFDALPGACVDISDDALAALGAERAEHHLLLRTEEHPDGAVAGRVGDGDPW